MYMPNLLATDCVRHAFLRITVPLVDHIIGRTVETVEFLARAWATARCCVLCTCEHRHAAFPQHVRDEEHRRHAAVAAHVAPEANNNRRCPARASMHPQPHQVLRVAARILELQVVKILKRMRQFLPSH